MTEQREKLQFVKSILKEPEEISHRRVFADWLEENEDPSAKIVRAWADKELEPVEEVRVLETWQEEMIPVVVEWFTLVGHQYGVTDKKEAEKAIEMAYQCAELEPPKEIQWIQSPQELGSDKVVRDKIRGGIRGKVWDKVWDKIRDKIRDKVWDKIRDKIRDKVWDKVWNGVWDKVWNGVWNGVWAGVVYSSQEVYWLSTYWFLKEIGGMKGIEDIQGMLNCSTECGWFMDGKNVCIVSELPTEFKEGEYIRFSDGFEVKL